MNNVCPDVSASVERREERLDERTLTSLNELVISESSDNESLAGGGKPSSMSGAALDESGDTTGPVSDPLTGADKSVVEENTKDKEPEHKDDASEQADSEVGTDNDEPPRSTNASIGNSTTDQQDDHLASDRVMPTALDMVRFYKDLRKTQPHEYLVDWAHDQDLARQPNIDIWDARQAYQKAHGGPDPAFMPYTWATCAYQLMSDEFKVTDFDKPAFAARVYKVLIVDKDQDKEEQNVKA